MNVWSDQFLGREVAIDTETTIAPFTSRDHRLITFQAYAGKEGYFVPRELIRDFLIKHLDSKLIFQHAPFDIGVLEHEVPKSLLLQFYDRDLIYDTKTMFKLLHLAVAGYVPHQQDTSLKALSKKILNREMNKDMEVRGTFGQFRDVSIMEIPKKWREYAMQDAINTFDIYCALLAQISRLDSDMLLSMHIQVKGEYAVNNMIKNGIGVDLDRVKEIRDKLEGDKKSSEERLAMWGWVRGRPKIKDIEESIFERIGISEQLPLTETGTISRKAEDLAQYSHLPFISDYLNVVKLEKTISFLEPLSSGILHPQYNPMANSGRILCSKPNFQNQPRQGDIRSCFIPKSKNKTFAMIDYSGIELCAVAQIHNTKFGSSIMGDLINDEVDLHTYFATRAFGKDKVTKEERQLGKIINFGLCANMGPDTFTNYAKQFDIIITEDKARHFKDIWLDTFPEMQQFFAEAAKAVNKDGKPTTTTLTGRQRADCTYTSFLNTQFQGLASDGLKLAMYELVKQGYHVVGAVHDEIIVEVDKGSSIEPIENIMINKMKEVMPDIKISVESQIKGCYTK